MLVRKADQFSQSILLTLKLEDVELIFSTENPT